MDIQDCKVRVTNVDTQQSGKNILVQVIGEMSNRAAPHRKFVQTFVLAEQPTGYFVLNDIFRNIVDDEEENGPAVEPGAGSLPAAEPASNDVSSTKKPIESQQDVEKVDQKLQETVTKDSHALPTASIVAGENGAPKGTASNGAEVVEGSSREESVLSKEQAAESVAREEADQPEKPRDPEPTPLASSPKPAKAAPAEVPSGPPKPSVPKTWANLVASKGASAPAPTPSNKPPTSSAAASASTKGPNTAVKDNNTPSAVANEDQNTKPQTNGGAAWQNVGSEKPRQNRQHSQSISRSQENVLAYVKNVTDKVDPSALRTVLAAFGKLEYFDVNRPKVCNRLSQT